MFHAGPFFKDSPSFRLSSSLKITPFFCVKWGKVGLTPINIGRIVAAVGGIGTFWEGQPGLMNKANGWLPRKLSTSTRPQGSSKSARALSQGAGRGIVRLDPDATRRFITLPRRGLG